MAISTTGVVVTQGFVLNSEALLDVRSKVDTYSDLALFSKYNITEGLIVYVKDEQQLYICTEVSDNSTWAKVGSDEIPAGVYIFKGSESSLDDLPTDAETGWVYNITAAFTLDGVDYAAGTNVAWTGEEWDALGGGTIDLDELAGNGLVLDGGTLSLDYTTLAGNGLTLGSNGVSLDVGVGSGITITSDAIAIDLDENSGLTLGLGGLSIDLSEDSGLTLTADGLEVAISEDDGNSLIIGTDGGLYVTAPDPIEYTAGDGIDITSEVISVSVAETGETTDNMLKVNTSGELYVDKFAADVTWGEISAS